MINGITILCNPGCASCSPTDASLCTQCAGGYYLDSGKCLKIRLSGCKLPDGANSCNGCFEGFYLVRSTTPVKCAKCSDSCLTCSSQTTCLSCKPGFKLCGTTCASCIDFCDDCTSPVAPKLCTKCMPGYNYNSDTHSCDQCPIPGCSNCPSPSSCSACADGFLLVASSN